MRLAKQYRMTKNHFSQKMTQHASLYMFIAISYHCCQNERNNDEEKKGKSLGCLTATVGRKGLKERLSNLHISLTLKLIFNTLYEIRHLIESI